MNQTNGQQNKQKQKAATKEQLYKVVLKDQTYTPMHFIDDLARRLFAMDHHLAQFVMMSLYQQGQAICGIYPKAQAQKKVKEVHALASDYKLGLTCELERL